MKITGTTRLAGIMGWPVSHSRSPLLHGFWLDQTGIDGAYVPLPVKPDHIEPALRALPLLGFRGCNLTVPHKQTAFAVVDLPWQKYVKYDPAFHRPADPGRLVGCPDKIRNTLGWQANGTFPQLVREMVGAELNRLDSDSAD